MPTLLLLLEAPLQSWGSQSRFSDRDTWSEPTKSGVIGLLASALGRDRSESITDLAALKFGVRVNKNGIIKTDFHIAGKGGYLRASGKIEKHDAIVTYRHFISGASFLAGVESEDTGLLERLYNALNNPRWHLFLGRKSFVPSKPVFLPDGLKQSQLIQSLAEYPQSPHYNKRNRQNKDADYEELRFAVEICHGELIGETLVMERSIADQPVDFLNRKFNYRKVGIFFKNVKLEQEVNNVC